MFGQDILLYESAKKLILPEQDKNEIYKIELICSITKNIKIITLLNKARDIYLIKNGIRFEEIYIDGFIYTLLNIMGLNNDPYYLYLQYIFKAFFDKYKYKITFRADFAILSQSRKIFLVMESKTMFNITFSNNLKEDQVIGEIFVIAYHSFFHKF